MNKRCFIKSVNKLFYLEKDDVTNYGGNHLLLSFNNIIPIGLFLSLIFCFYNYLNFVSYDIYAISPLFLWTTDFFLEHLKNSFSFNNYLSLFFIQFFYSRLIASIIIAFLLTVLFITFRHFLGYFSTSKICNNTGSFSVVVGTSLIIEQNIIADTISFLIILWTIILLKKIAKNKYLGAVTLIVNFILWWTIQPFYILYLILLPLIIFINKKKLSYIVFTLNFLLAVFLYGYRYLLVNFTPDYSCWTFIMDVFSTKYLLFSFLIIFTPIVLRYLKWIKIKMILSICVLIILCVNGVKYTDISSNKNAEAIIKHKFNSGNWGSLLDYAIKKNELSQTSAMCVNYALYREKHLTDQAFSYDQYYSDKGLLPEFKLGKDKLSYLNFFYNRNAVLLGEIYYDLGLYSMAQRIATDFLAHTENQPQLLLFLTKVHLAKGEKKAASKYTEILKRNLIYKPKVEKLLCTSGNHILPNTTPNEILLSTPVNNLYSLLNFPEKNEMALEYYITYSLLGRNFSSIPFIIKKLKEYGYTKLPHDFEYFIYLAHTLTKKEIETGTLKKDPQRHMEYSSFLKKLEKTRNKKEAIKELKKYDKSYMYYFFINKTIETLH